MHFHEVILSLLGYLGIYFIFFYVMPAYRKSTARRVQRTATPTDDEADEMFLSRFAHPHHYHEILRRHPLQPYPSITDLSNRIRDARDHPLDQTGLEFADTWLPDQIIARHRIFADLGRLTSLPPWAQLMIERGFSNEGGMVQTEQVRSSPVA